MGGFERHHAAGMRLFPVASLGFVVPIYVGTGDPTLVLFALTLGSVLVRVSAVVPDIDSHRSVPRQALGRFLTGALLAVLFLSSVNLVVPANLFPMLLAALPLGFTPAALLVVLFLWTGLASRHRSVTHSGIWGLALSLAVGTTAFTAIQWTGPRPAAVVGAAAATYSFVGFYSHLAVDEEYHVRWTPDEREFDDYRQYLSNRTEQFRWLTVPAIVGGVAFTSAGIVVLAALGMAYVGLVAGLTLPAIERKRSEPRRVLDRIGTLVVAVLLLQQLLATGIRVQSRVAPSVLELPAGTVPAFFFLLLVLWLGRDAGQLGPSTVSVTHSLLWPVAVAAGVVLVVVAGTAALPVQVTGYLSGIAGGSVLLGFYHHFRVDGIIAPPTRRTDHRA